ncbi:MAG: hypothetical protein SNH88_05045 [Rikenellaceae bacterium]
MNQTQIKDPAMSCLLMQMARAANILTAEGQQELTERESIAEIVEGDGEPSYEFVTEVVEICSTIARLDLASLWEVVIFSWVVGCNEMDMNSIALHSPNRGVCSLAPIQRLSSSLGRGDETALTINGKRKGITRRDILKAMISSGVKERTLNLIVKALEAAKPRWAELIAESQITPEQRVALKDLIDRRLALL